MMCQFPDRREGLFQVGDRVRWTTQGKTKRGVIVEAVKWGQYPDRKWPIAIHGFYREHWSYVVQTDDDRAYWPRVGTLRKEIGR